MSGHGESTPVAVVETQQQAEASIRMASPLVERNKTLSKLIEEYKELETLKQERNKEGYIKDTKEQKKARDIRNNLQNIVLKIQKPGTTPEIVLPQFADDIIKKIHISQISEDSAPIVYEFLRITKPGSGIDYANPEGMEMVLDLMMDVAQFEPFMAEKILEPLLQEARRIGCTAEQMEKADRFVNWKHYARDDKQTAKTEREEWKTKTEAVFAPVRGVALGVVAEEKIHLEYRAYKNEGKGDVGHMNSTEYEAAIKAKIQVETNNMQGEILSALNDVVSSLNSRGDNPQARGKYELLLSNLKLAGKISEGDYKMLQTLPDNSELREYMEKNYRRGEGDDLVQRAMQVFVPTEQQMKTLRGISSAHSLMNLLQTEKGERGIGYRYMNNVKLDSAGQIDWKVATVNWEAFSRDVKDLFGELLSIADRNPDKFFQEAFNPMYEGHLYQVLLQRISHLGAQIDSSDNSWLKEKQIDIVTRTPVPSPSTPEAPFTLHSQTQIVTHNLGVAVGRALQKEMNDYKFIKEHLHNISAICVQGLGWEQVKQYAERLDLAHLDRLMQQEEGLSLASNFLSDALKQEIAVNNKVTMTSLGLTDEVWQLNSAERLAFFQMKAYLHTKHPLLNENALNQQSMQKIRMAAAISYGLTGEFWNIMLTARMPMGSKKGVNSMGEEVQIIDTSFLGTHHRGYEKMIGELDLDMVLQRFALPKLYNDLRYCPRYRNMKHPPGPYEEYFQHGLASELRSEIEDALVNGRSARLTELDTTYVCFMDYMRTKCVGLFARGGWRFKNWEVYKKYSPENPDKLDYIKTLATVRMRGSFITKRFIDDELKPESAEKMTENEVFALIGIRKRGSQLTKKEKELFNKEFLYGRLLFSQMSRVGATKFLQLEERRWTPRGERMLRNDLSDYLGTQYKNHKYPPGFLNLQVYNMYVSALTLAEKSTWLARRNDEQDYEFGATDIEEHSTELRTFFEEYKKGIGIIKIEQTGFEVQIGTKIEIGKTEDEVKEIQEKDFKEFIQNLKGFQSTLANSIKLPRYEKENNGGKSESLQQRFAKMLASGTDDYTINNPSSMGNIENLIAGDDFDFENFSFQAGGGYAATRMAGETFAVTSKMNPALAKLINEELPNFVKGEYKDLHEVEKFFKDKFAPLFKEIHGAIAGMDKNQADEYCISLALFVANMVGKDRILRIKGFGSMYDYWRRQHKGGSQASLFGEFYRNEFMRPSHSMDSDEIHAFGHIVLNAINLPFSKRIPDHVETTFSLFGKPIGTRTVYKDEINPEYELVEKKLFGLIPYKRMEKKHKKGDTHDWHEEIFGHASGNTPGMKWLETYLPFVGVALFLILIAMAYLANQKNKKK